MVTKSKQAWRLGPRLKAAREGVGLSQREAAKAADVSPTTWGQLESGVVKKGSGLESPVNPRAAIVIAAAQVVGMNPVEALTLAGLDPSRHQVSTARPTVGQQKLNDVFARLNERQRRALLELMEAMLAVGEDEVGDGRVPALGRSDKEVVSRTPARP